MTPPANVQCATVVTSNVNSMPLPGHSIPGLDTLGWMRPSLVFAEAVALTG